MRLLYLSRRSLSIFPTTSKFIVADVDFFNAPMKQCNVIKEKMKELIGINIFSQFDSKANELFFGEMGCPNIRMLLGISVPAIIYSYFHHQIKMNILS